MTCRTCHGTGQIVREGRRHYVHDTDGGGARPDTGAVVDACPVCAAEAEAEWQAITLPPLVRRIAAE